jgi:hypothetical protein
MPIYKRATNAWAIGAPRRRSGGSMVTVGSLLVRQAGVWVQKAAMSLALAPASVVQNAPNGSRTSSFTVQITGGVGPFSYSWSWQDGGQGTTLTNTATATVTINTSGNNTLREGTIRVVVTDAGTGLQTSKTGRYSIQFGTPV